MGKLEGYGHSPRWPGYINTTEHKNAKSVVVFDGKVIKDINGNETPIREKMDILNYMEYNTGIIFIESIMAEPIFNWLFDFVCMDTCIVKCSKSGVPVSMEFRYGKYKRRIVSAGVWNIGFDDTFINSVIELCTRCNIWDGYTPASVGQSLMRKTWYMYKLDWHTVPSMHCTNFLLNNRFGARKGFYGNTDYYDELVELDISSAYPIHYVIHPTGTPVYSGRGFSSSFTTWFARCEVTINHRLPIGPFPIRNRNGYRIFYPTEPGVYNTYLWKEQAEACIDIGCIVMVGEGYGWEAMTNDNRYWVDHMKSIRNDAQSDTQKFLVKLVTNSAIGAMGRDGKEYTLVSSENSSREDVCICDAGGPIDLWRHEKQKYSQRSMVHWNTYTVNMTSLSLYYLALPYAINGTLVSMDTDCIRIIGDDVINLTRNLQYDIHLKRQLRRGVRFKGNRIVREELTS